MAKPGVGLSSARRKLGTVDKSLRLTRQGTLAPSAELKASIKEANRMAKRMKNLSVPLRVGAADVKRLIDDSFRNERDPAGEAWQEVTEETEWNKMLNEVFGRHRGRRKATVKADTKILGAMRVPGAISRKSHKRERSQAEKARETREKQNKLNQKERLKAQNFNSKILVDTARLRNSWYARAGKTSIIFGTNVEYGDYHQRGAGVPERKMAPVELIGGQWKVINRGPAKITFDKIGRAIQDYVAPQVK